MGIRLIGGLERLGCFLIGQESYSEVAASFLTKLETQIDDE